MTGVVGNVGGGGAEGIRTPDLLIANETLYQLSYDPVAPNGTRGNRKGRLKASVVPCRVSKAGGEAWGLEWDGP